MPHVALLLLLLPAALHAQSTVADAYGDPVARQLVARAREVRDESSRALTSYTALVSERSALLLRMPLKDRLIDREESAARIRWTRDGGIDAFVLAGRTQDEDGVGVNTSAPGPIFDPTADRIHFGLGWAGSTDGEQSWLLHPLASGSEQHYRFRSGDTVTVRLADGSAIRVVELRAVPRRPSFRHLAGVLWIDLDSGALARAVFRSGRRLDLLRDSVLDPEDREDLASVPGVLRPIEMEIESVVIDYSLWKQEHWLPRLVRVEGYARAGPARFALTDETSYRIEEVEVAGEPHPSASSPGPGTAAWSPAVELRTDTTRRHGQEIRVHVPEDVSRLLDSPALPPPVWAAAPEFASEAELEGLLERLGSVPRGSFGDPVRLGFEWGLGGAGLVRYNRVEGLSIGARALAEHPLLEAQATLRLGSADLHPNVELGVVRPGVHRTLSLDLYHHLDSVDGEARALGFGSSLGTLLLGRDDGEYYRATGARLSLSPPRGDRGWYGWTLFAERQRPAARGTEWSLASLAGGAPLRPNLAADSADLLGAGLRLRPWWGRDPKRLQGGLDLQLEGAAGDYQFARARVTARAARPLGERHRLGMEAGAGTAWGAVPAQYRWFLGGPATLRGYGGSAAVGTSFLRARAELARGSSFGALTLFGDAAWAGERSAFDAADALVSAGIGASLFDGLLRVDLARALRSPTGWRLEMYLDALL